MTLPRSPSTARRNASSPQMAARLFPWYTTSPGQRRWPRLIPAGLSIPPMNMMAAQSGCRSVPDGYLSDLTTFAERGEFASVTDTTGNVYIAAGQVYKYDVTGRQTELIKVPRTAYGPHHRPERSGYPVHHRPSLAICSDDPVNRPPPAGPKPAFRSTAGRRPNHDRMLYILTTKN
jgi:hypothetical protein